MKYEQILKERDDILNTLYQHTGALKELTFLVKNHYIPIEIYNKRFDAIMFEFNKLKATFDKLGEQAREL